MNRIILFSVAAGISFFMSARDVQAQTSDSIPYETLDINNIHAKIAQSNTQFLPEMFNRKVGYRYPASSTNELTPMYSYALWIGGIDIVGQLRLAAERFNQLGYDFQPGPLDSYGNINQNTIRQWNRVWKVSALEIQNFITAIQNNGNLAENEVPEAIRTWPAHGDESNGELPNIAPFFDNDGDGVYNWRKGDYPLIKGDQCVFFVYNDARQHSESGGYPLRIEIHTMAYAFGDPNDTAFWNSMFFNYTIHNRSTLLHNNVYLGIWADFDIGYAYDDYIGCDVERGMFYGYNGKIPDGIGLPTHYGNNPPAQGIAILGGAPAAIDGEDNPSYNKQADDNIYGPSFNANYNSCEIVQAHGNVYEFTWDSTGNGDMVTRYVTVRADAINGLNFGNGIVDDERLGMSKFVYHNNDITVTGDPQVAVDYYNLLRGVWKDNTPITYGGTGYNSSSTAYCNFMFPGDSDPCNWGTNGLPTSQDWTEESEGNMYSDRRGLASSGPFTFEAGQTIQFDIALVSGMMEEDSGNPYSAVETIKKYATQIKTEFSVMPEKFQNRKYGQVTMGIPSFSHPNAEKIFSAYPNPVTNNLHVELIDLEIANYTIYNIVGQIIENGTINKTANINIQNLSTGMYYLRISDKTVKFTKE